MRFWIDELYIFFTFSEEVFTYNVFSFGSGMSSDYLFTELVDELTLLPDYALLFAG